jgi:hypothetical protein
MFLLPAFLHGRQPPVVVTYATWNPSDKSSSVSLSGGNLVAANTSFSAGGVRGTLGKSSGKWYCELLIGGEQTGVTNREFGVTTTATAVGGIPGIDDQGWGYRAGNGTYIRNGSETGSVSTSDVGARIMMALDLNAGKIWWGRNGTWFGSGDPAAGTNAAFSSVSGTLYPHWYTSSAGFGGINATINFGASAFAYTVPTGFSGWSN